MTPTHLFTRYGTYVTTVSVPPFAKPIELISWGDRFFVLHSSGQYREVLCYSATEVAAP